VREAGISPTKSLGQHFLTDANILNRIVAAASLTADDTVIEIGPGLGALTQRLLEAAGPVIAVELDAKLADRLVKISLLPDESVASAAASALLARRGVGGEVSPLTVVHTDALLVSPADLLEAASLPPETPYVVVGNLPYNAGTAIVRRFLEATHQPQRLIVMLQREVAESMTSPAGDMGLLAVSVQVYADARRLFNVPPRAFYPPPKVTSTVLRLDVRSEPLVPVEEIDSFFRVVRAGFSAPRKQLRNTLANGLAISSEAATSAIDDAGLDGSVRPALLSVDDWLRLSRAVGT
jgi:16S rRNA (adenine1518-N6/adenine1519-N6)-dimethyltransferase